MLDLATNPTPGIFPGIANADYHRIPAVSSTALKQLHTRSPLHARDYLDSPHEPTPAMEFGSAAHACIIEPERFGGEYVVAGQCEAVTGKGTRCTRGGTARLYDGTWWCTQHQEADDEYEPATVLAEADAEKLRTMLRMVWRDGSALGRVLRKATRKELTVIWRDDATGLLCKARPDILIDHGDYAYLYDLKTCGDIVGFGRQAWNLAYHLQLAHYAAGLAAHGIDVEAVGIVAVETARPHDCVRYELADDLAAVGREDWRRALNRYAECDRNNDWPGVAAEPRTLEIPTWARRQIETEWEAA